MTTHGPSDSSGRIVQGTRMHVDAGFGGAAQNGSFESPFLTIQEGIDAQALLGAGTVIVADGAYTEDLAFEDGVDVEGESPGGVVVTGSAVADDVTLVITNINFLDDGAGDAFEMDGVAADVVRCIMCDFSSTATGDYAIACTNTAAAATLTLNACTAAADVANANAVVTLASGTLYMRECDIVHASNVQESVELLGTAASTFEARDTVLVGTLAHENAAVAPTVTLTNVDITVAAVSAAVLAGGVTLTYLGGNVISTDAGFDAFDGTGTMVIGDVKFLSTADEYATTLTITQAVGSLLQHGSITEAGGGAVVPVTLPMVMPSVNYTVILTYEDTGAGAQASTVECDTIATTGFNITTTANGVWHWLAIHD